VRIRTGDIICDGDGPRPGRAHAPRFRMSAASDDLVVVSGQSMSFPQQIAAVINRKRCALGEYREPPRSQAPMTVLPVEASCAQGSASAGAGRFPRRFHQDATSA